MIDFVKMKYRRMRSSLKFCFSVNWIKTIWFNYKMFPSSIAYKLPVIFYGNVSFSGLKGKIIINAPIKKGMIGFGRPYEMFTKSKRNAQLILNGTLIFKGHVQFGLDFNIHIGEKAVCELGHMASMASNGKIICNQHIVLGDYARLGSESQIIDTNFHQMIDTITGEKLAIVAPIEIGNYNFISNRVSILSGTKTPDYCTIASNTVCTKDYSSLGLNILIGGVPAKLLKENISRDWEGERNRMEQWLIPIS